MPAAGPDSDSEQQPVVSQAERSVLTNSTSVGGLASIHDPKLPPSLRAPGPLPRSESSQAFALTPCCPPTRLAGAWGAKGPSSRGAEGDGDGAKEGEREAEKKRRREVREGERARERARDWERDYEREWEREIEIVCGVFAHTGSVGIAPGQFLRRQLATSRVSEETPSEILESYY
jgi:hypothetical protein